MFLKEVFFVKCVIYIGIFDYDRKDKKIRVFLIYVKKFIVYVLVMLCFWGLYCEIFYEWFYFLWLMYMGVWYYRICYSFIVFWLVLRYGIIGSMCIYFLYIGYM